MDCLTVLLTCLLNGTYVSAGVEANINKPDGEGRWCDVEHNKARSDWCKDPMGVLKVGTRLELTKHIDLDLGLTHTSYMNSNDRGLESAYLQITWRPFRR